MRSKSVAWVLGFILLGTLIFFSGCKPKSATSGKPEIMGIVIVGRDSVPAATVEVNYSKSLPVVAVNSETLSLSDYQCNYNYFSDEQVWSSWWEKDPLELLPGKKCVLHIYQADGEAQTDSLMVPWPPVFTSPGGGFTLKGGTPLPIAWTSGTGVERYYLQIELYYSYRDTARNYRTFSLDTSMYLPGTVTSFTLPAANIFPLDVDSVLSGSGSIELQAEIGWKAGSNPKGNIKGNGYGYFWTYSDNYCNFGIGGSQLSGTSRTEPKPGEIAKQVLARKKAELERE